MPTDLSDLAAYGVKPKQKKEGPQPKPISYVLLWTRTVCACGAEYNGPRNGYNPSGYKKYWHPQKRAYFLYPIGQAETLNQNLTREVETKEEHILLCPWCIYDFSTPTHIPGEILHTNAYDAINTEDAESSEAPPFEVVERPEGEVSLEDLAEGQEEEARKEEQDSDKNFTGGLE